MGSTGKKNSKKLAHVGGELTGWRSLGLEIVKRDPLYCEGNDFDWPQAKACLRGILAANDGLRDERDALRAQLDEARAKLADATIVRCLGGGLNIYAIEAELRKHIAELPINGHDQFIGLNPFHAAEIVTALDLVRETREKLTAKLAEQSERATAIIADLKAELLKANNRGDEQAAELARLRASQAGPGLPNIGETVEVIDPRCMRIGKIARYLHPNHNREYPGFKLEDGGEFDWRDEGKTWRRIPKCVCISRHPSPNIPAAPEPPEPATTTTMYESYLDPRVKPATPDAEAFAIIRQLYAVGAWPQHIELNGDASARLVQAVCEAMRLHDRLCSECGHPVRAGTTDANGIVERCTKCGATTMDSRKPAECPECGHRSHPHGLCLHLLDFNARCGCGIDIGDGKPKPTDGGEDKCPKCNGPFVPVRNLDGETELHHNCSGPVWGATEDKPAPAPVMTRLRAALCTAEVQTYKHWCLEDAARDDQAEAVAGLQSNYEFVLKNYTAEKLQRQSLAVQRTELMARIAALEADLAVARYEAEMVKRAARDLEELRSICRAHGSIATLGMDGYWSIELWKFSTVDKDNLRRLLGLDGKEGG